MGSVSVTSLLDWDPGGLVANALYLMFGFHANIHEDLIFGFHGEIHGEIDGEIHGEIHGQIHGEIHGEIILALSS